MKILKVINNNVVSGTDDQGREIVAMGRGLGFRAKLGMELKPEAADKIFRMETQEQANRLGELIADLPAGLLEICTRVIEYAAQTLGRELNENIYLSLTDHIKFSLERCRRGESLPNPLFTEVRVFYPEEYTIGCYARDLISARMKAELPRDEAASIALHLVNAEYGRTMNATMHTARALQPMVDMLENASLQLDRESLRYDELLIHLKFMAMEAFTQHSGESADPLLLERFIPASADAINCAKAICEYLSQESGNHISEAEAIHLAVCIQRAVMPKQ